MSLFGNGKARLFFSLIVSYPKTVIFGSLLLILFFASFLTGLTKDVSSDSFINKDNPALIYKNKIKETFGLTDPMVIAIYHEDSIYNLETIHLLLNIYRLMLLYQNLLDCYL